MSDNAVHAGKLHTSLRRPQLTMLAIGGTMGAGLFIGSGALITQTGPLAVATYAVTGVLIMLVMRMLGEMAVANPRTGSFTDYARDALGNWAGFSSAWLYWYYQMVVVGFEAVVGAQLLQRWIHGVPNWIMSVILLLILTVVNLVSVGNFGRFEYWFSGIKVAAVTLFVVLATCFVLGLWPGATIDFSNLTDHGGLAPNGVLPMFSGVVVVIFSMVGAEVVTVAAAESAEPGLAIKRAVNAVVYRVLFFFVASSFLIVTIVPWNSIPAGTSPFLNVLQVLNIPGVADILNLVILVAVLSCLNVSLYSSSRMLFTLAANGDCPAWMSRTNHRGVPVLGVLSCTVIGYACIAVGYFFPDTVFLFLINASGAMILFVYLMICVSQIVLRRRNEANNGARFQFAMWCFPYLSIAVTAAIVLILLSMLRDATSRVSLIQGLVVWAIVLIAFAAKTLRRRYSAADDGSVSDAAADDDLSAAPSVPHPSNSA
ncbi:amino acid permease [Mycolicibacterium canariasense]|nr:amino acid permease [Mycolicibacterium canariasense]ORV12545.1 GABA permease [Mycolicibacterium canariasense]